MWIHCPSLDSAQLITGCQLSGWLSVVTLFSASGREGFQRLVGSLSHGRDGGDWGSILEPTNDVLRHELCHRGARAHRCGCDMGQKGEVIELQHLHWNIGF